MSLDATFRRVVYQADGKTTAFPFRFKVFSATDVVVQAGGEDGVSLTLSYGTEYSVALNPDQENEPGGTVTVFSAPASGNVAIISGIPETQPMVLTPYDGFNPETLNTSADRSVALIQQLSERLDRAVTVDATDVMTPTELKKKLLDAANEATVIAKGYAEDAKASAEEAKKAEQATGEYAEAAKIIVPMQDEIEAVAGGIDDVKAVSGGLDAVKTVAANVETVGTVADHIEDVVQAAKVSPHIDDVVSIKAHIDEVHRVGQDLVGLSVPYLDLGEVTEEADEVTKVTDGYIKKVAEHIDDCIHPVGDNLGTIETVAANVETVGTVAKHLDDCIHPVGSSIDAIELVAGQLEPINAVAGLSHVDYEAIFLNGLPDEGETNGLSD